MRIRIKVIHSFIIFCFVIPFLSGIYINVSFARSSSNINNIDAIPLIYVNEPKPSPSASLPAYEDVIVASPTPAPTVSATITAPSQTPSQNTAPSPSPMPSPTPTSSDKNVTVAVFNRESNEVVNMRLDEYLICVVAAEMPATFEQEALNAQAIAARTFTIIHMSGSCSSNPKAKVCTYYGCCQAYVSPERMKKNWGDQYQEKYAKITQAVYSTDSIIMTYDNKPITVFYYSTSNGKTEACQDVFVKNLPYYKSVESPGEETAPNFKSYVKISTDEFVKILNDEFSANVTTSNVKDSITLQRSAGGRVKTFTVNGISIKGTKIRTAFGLRSTDFTLTFNDNYVQIDVCGNGHGVGMSQYGADYMAKNGSNYEEILKHYYIGVSLEPHGK
ncbi:MAG: stage II sporulation protein D [Clostridiales bacterium]|nr:stage II sporulation protein D [Clostridiales bacterium]